MQGRHDRTPVALLHGHALRVHRHIQRAGGRAHDEQGEAEPDQVGRQREKGQAQAVARDGHGGRGATAVAVRGGAGERHRDQRSDRGHEQGEPELSVARAELGLDLGDARHPAAVAEAVQAEDHGDPCARSEQRRDLIGTEAHQPVTWRSDPRGALGPVSCPKPIGHGDGIAGSSLAAPRERTVPGGGSARSRRHDRSGSRMET